MNSTTRNDLAAELAALDAKINALLPPRYQHCYADVPPVSMGSAGLKYGPDGKVAWGQIWTTYCDLALAGGPPHRGKLLEPVPEEEVAAHPDRQAEVVAEIDRALGLTAGVAVVEGHAPGWVGVPCESVEAAAWLQFAVTAENVSARRRGAMLQLPAGPAFRPEKEIKNLVVALNKSFHYWDGHLTASQQGLAGEEVWEAATPAEVAAAPAQYAAAVREVEEGVRATGLPISARSYAGWLGVETADEDEAVWLLRAVLAERVLARREENTLFLPLSASPGDGRAARVARVFARAWELWKAHVS
jgi:hypothetical protein